VRRSQTLILFARLPRLGAGKRRLARDIGAVAALRFERLMLARSLRRLGRDRRWTLRLAVTPDRAAPRWPGGFPVLPQGEGDLGERMRRAMAACPPGPVVLVGTDIPGLTAAHIAEAFALLGRHDVVFGPASDGGFWLVGARHRPPKFGSVRWSSRHALEDVLANLPRSVSVGFAARLDDVDDGDAYRRLGKLRGLLGQCRADE
jgi:rSAM/selenodomain-associated transferase 1